jgi:hypothetical protein
VATIIDALEAPAIAVAVEQAVVRVELRGNNRISAGGLGKERLA